jgi:hypothetical protein
MTLIFIKMQGFFESRSYSSRMSGAMKNGPSLNRSFRRNTVVVGRARRSFGPW